MLMINGHRSETISFLVILTLEHITLRPLLGASAAHLSRCVEARLA